MSDSGGRERTREQGRVGCRHLDKAEVIMLSPKKLGIKRSIPDNCILPVSVVEANNGGGGRGGERNKKPLKNKFIASLQCKKEHTTFKGWQEGHMREREKSCSISAEPMVHFCMS